MPGWREAYAEPVDTSVPIENWIAAQISENVEAEPLPNSRVVSLSYEALAARTRRQASRMPMRRLHRDDAGTERRAGAPQRRLVRPAAARRMRARLDAARARMTEDAGRRKASSRSTKSSAPRRTRLDDISRNLVEAQMATAAARARQLGENHPEYQSALQRERALAGALDEQKANILRIDGPARRARHARARGAVRAAELRRDAAGVLQDGHGEPVQPDQHRGPEPGVPAGGAVQPERPAQHDQRHRCSACSSVSSPPFIAEMVEPAGAVDATASPVRRRADHGS